MDMLTGNIWKLGCNWGSGMPSFYNFIKSQKIIIGFSEKPFNINDLILITEGHQVLSLARLLESPQPVTTKPDLKEQFEEYKIDYESWVFYAAAEWYELPKEEQFKYKLQQGICNVGDRQVREKATKLWNERNCNFWIFQRAAGHGGLVQYVFHGRFLRWNNTRFVVFVEWVPFHYLLLTLRQRTVDGQRSRSQCGT